MFFVILSRGYPHFFCFDMYDKEMQVFLQAKMIGLMSPKYHFSETIF